MTSRQLALAVSGIIRWTLVAGAFAGLWMLLPSPRIDQNIPTEALLHAMEEIGLPGGEPDFRTLVVASVVEVNAPGATAWTAWSNTDEWSRWNGRLIRSAEWDGEAGWRRGNRLVLDRTPGFPLGDRRSVAVIVRASPGRQVLWRDEVGDDQGCCVWLFEDLPGGGSRISAVEARRGWSVAFYKPLVAGSWQRRLVSGLENIRSRLGGPAPAGPAVSTPGDE